MSSFEEYMPDINFKAEHPELYQERKPKFKIGDVVENFTEKCEKDNDNQYFIQKAILEYDGIHSPEYVYEVGMINSPDRIYKFNEDELEFQYHDKKWEKYVTESYRNTGLAAWRGSLYSFMKLTVVERDNYENDTLPPRRMQHILGEYSFYRRMDDLMHTPMKDEIVKRMDNCTKKDVETIISSIKDKILYYNGLMPKNGLPSVRKGHDNTVFNVNENKLISVIDYVDKHLNKEGKDHYPPYMSDFGIMKAIQEAYGNAEKVELIKNRYNPQAKKVLFQGKSKNGLTIQFYYNFEAKIIETAYPVGRAKS